MATTLIPRNLRFADAPKGLRWMFGFPLGVRTLYDGEWRQMPDEAAARASLSMQFGAGGHKPSVIVNHGHGEAGAVGVVEAWRIVTRDEFAAASGGGDLGYDRAVLFGARLKPAYDQKYANASVRFASPEVRIGYVDDQGRRFACFIGELSMVALGHFKAQPGSEVLAGLQFGDRVAARSTFMDEQMKAAIQAMIDEAVAKAMAAKPAMETAEKPAAAPPATSMQAGDAALAARLEAAEVAAKANAAELAKLQARETARAIGDELRAAGIQFGEPELATHVKYRSIATDAEWKAHLDRMPRDTRTFADRHAGVAGTAGAPLKFSDMSPEDKRKAIDAKLVELRKSNPNATFADARTEMIRN